jgi:hypothetical protein
VYARLSKIDAAVVAEEERDTLYVGAATRLGCEVSQIYEDYDISGCYDAFRKLWEDCQNGSYDAIVLFDLTVGFARWQPYEKKLAEFGVACIKARAETSFAREKAVRWKEYLRQKREKEWQDWVDHATQPMLYEPEGE